MLTDQTKRKRGGIVALKKPIAYPDRRNLFRVQQGLILWQHREKTGLNLAEVAKQIGVAETTLCRWESGQGPPSGENLWKLAQFYQCPIQDLYPKGVGNNELSKSRHIA